MKFLAFFFCMMFVTILIGTDIKAQVTINQVDNFEDGTVQGWLEGGASPNKPTNIADGGPAGAGDNYLQNVSTGNSDAGGKLVMFNRTQWKGDYTSAGITFIQMDINNMGSTDLEIRLAFKGSGGQFSSTNSIALAAGSGWQSVLFPIDSSNLTAVDGGNDVNATLSNVSEMRILHNTSPNWRGLSVDAVLGVDNLTATSTPVSVNLVDSGIPENIQLKQNYPNPFNPLTNIEFQISKTTNVELTIFDLLGKPVATIVNELKTPGFYITQWNGKDNFGKQVSSGVYIYRMNTNEFRTSKKLILMK